jgi:hypothetical protein
MNGGRRRGSGGIPCGQCPPVIDSGQEVGRGVGRARAAGKEERKWGKGEACGGDGDCFNTAHRVGDDRWGGATRQVRAERGERERGGERGGGQLGWRPDRSVRGWRTLFEQGREAPGH